MLFDPDYVSKRIPVDLTNVSLSDALRIVGTIAGTFYKAITPDTIFVALNSRQKHQDLDDLAVQTFYLTNPSQASDANEIYTALRNMLPAGREELPGSVAKCHHRARDAGRPGADREAAERS